MSWYEHAITNAVNDLYKTYGESRVIKYMKQLKTSRLSKKEERRLIKKIEKIMKESQEKLNKTRRNRGLRPSNRCDCPNCVTYR